MRRGGGQPRVISVRKEEASPPQLHPALHVESHQHPPQEGPPQLPDVGTPRRGGAAHSSGKWDGSGNTEQHGPPDRTESKCGSGGCRAEPEPT